MLEAATSVQEFYERYPYPPPIDDLGGYRSAWSDGRRRHEHHLLWPARPFRDDHSILVAGCGTSQAAKYALRWPAARVTGIDVSTTSIQSTEALKRTHNIENLHLHQLPLERVAELETRFDQIVCTGVLHHLPDPVAGLRALREVLAADGALLLMVYAPYGRAGVYLIQEFCRRTGIGATEDGVRDLVAALRALPLGHPLGRLLHQAPDFRDLAAIRDALLHPRDRAYSVPQTLDVLVSGRLGFGRWVRQAPYSARCGVLARLPHAERMARLPAAEEFAAVELFRGTMVRHSLIAVPDDSCDRAPVVRFDGDGWLKYVPIRTPDAISVTERLPTGSAAVLINRAHVDTDLILPVDEQERRWVEAIDGERTIGEISGAPSVSARAFFERLWWYDQVVFDTSRPERGLPPA